MPTYRGWLKLRMTDALPDSDWGNLLALAAAFNSAHTDDRRLSGAGGL